MNKKGETVLVKCTGDISGEDFSGSFKVKSALTHSEHLEQDKIRRELTGESANPSVRTMQTAEFLSQCAVRILEAPSWWTNSADGTGISGTKLLDDNLISDVYTAVMQVDVRVKRALDKQAEEAKQELVDDAKK